MNLSQALSRCNPQAVAYDPKVDGGGNWSTGASFDEALGFVSSCHGVSALAHYSIIPSDDYQSRNAVARELVKSLDMLRDRATLLQVTACVEVFVNRHEQEKQGALKKVPTPVYNLLYAWEREWMQKLGCVDDE